MLHLLQRTVSPALGLETSIENWYDISCSLREAPRQRRLQIEELESQ